MTAIRGEKLTFRKKDIVALHELPSAQATDPLIVHCPPPRGPMRRAVAVFLTILSLIVVAMSAFIGAVETGILDEPLTRQAEKALDSAIGPRYRAEVGSTVIRFTPSLQLALEARNVNMVERDTGQHLSTTGVMRLALDPLGLLRGKVAVEDVEARSIGLDTALLPAGKPIELAQLRVDDLPKAMDGLFAQLDTISGFIARAGTDRVRLSGMEIKLADTANGPLEITVDSLSLRRIGSTKLQLDGVIGINGEKALLSVSADCPDGKATRLVATARNINITPFSLRRNEAGEKRQGFETYGDLKISAVRGGEARQPVLAADVTLKPGTLYMDGDPQGLSGAELDLSYDFTKQTLEIGKSTIAFGNTEMPFNGALIDLDRLDPTAGKGFGIDLLISGGKAAPTTSGEAPLSFDIQTTGRYLVASRELQFPKIAVTSPLGALYGSVHLKLSDVSPEISFVGQSDRMQTAMVKQLWPYWMAPKAREWTEQNLFGGTVSNASISVFIPTGALDEAVGKGLRLDENQLRIKFDIVSARLNVAGDIPPVRDTAAHFDLQGKRLTVAIDKGTSYFPSGRAVGIGPGTFVLPSTYDKPLMAEIALKAGGPADAVAELLTYKPIQVLQRIDMKPEDFAGGIEADVQARFGIIMAHDPPPPQWKAAMRFIDVDLARPMDGHVVTKINGDLDADPQRVILTGKGQIDGIPADIALTEPVDKTAGIERQRKIVASLDDAQRDKLIPGLSEIVGGAMKVELDQAGDKQSVSMDLSKSVLRLPWVGWSKGSGIAAAASFDLSTAGDGTALRNFRLKGDGFGASGSLSLDKEGLAKADLDNVKLSSADNFAVSLRRSKGGMEVAVSGESADLRPVLAQLKGGDSARSGGSGGEAKDASSFNLRAKLGRITGFNDEQLANVDLDYAGRGAKLQALNFSGVTGSGEAVVGKMNGGGTLTVTSGDAGAVARFSDLYQHMRGGLLNVSVRFGEGEDWDGSVDIRRFALVNEKRLKSIVSTPVGNEQRSLNSAIKREIDTSAQRFQRGFARIYSRSGSIRVENGVVRGDQVGAVFQGLLRDGKGNMDMTGTFMPAYGLNRLFAELPLIGIILGNGSDRGLIGITFKLTGDLDSPNLQINPLSIIAPGVFRNIFEFQ